MGSFGEGGYQVSGAVQLGASPTVVKMKIGKYYYVYLIGGHSHALEALGEFARPQSVLSSHPIHLLGSHTGVYNYVLAR